MNTLRFWFTTALLLASVILLLTGPSLKSKGLLLTFLICSLITSVGYWTQTGVSSPAAVHVLQLIGMVATACILGYIVNIRRPSTSEAELPSLSPSDSRNTIKKVLTTIGLAVLGAILIIFVGRGLLEFLASWALSH